MNPIFSKQLANATVQEIQLELLRRSSFNAFDGEKVVATLLGHRELWQAAMLDRFCISRPGKLPTAGLIKLRDLDANIWNADTLYILAPNAKCAKQLSRIAKKDRWGGEVSVHDDPEEVDTALVGAEEGQAVVKVWWD